jgi:hypothetical protein
MGRKPTRRPCGLKIYTKKKVNGDRDESGLDESGVVGIDYTDEELDDYAGKGTDDYAEEDPYEVGEAPEGFTWVNGLGILVGVAGALFGVPIFF